jgi:PIN domain nuclease of toxin-antitoxin system
VGAVVADTHTVVWYLLTSGKLSPDALVALDQAIQDGEPIYVSSISIVELTYLVEKGRLPTTALDRLTQLLAAPNSGYVLIPLDLFIAQAIQRIPRDAIPEMPDRIIAATALHLDLPLVTRDLRIRTSGIKTIW